MAIKNYTTKVDVYTSIGEIQGALARHGATKIMIDYDNGKPQAIAFGIDTPVGRVASVCRRPWMGRCGCLQIRRSRPTASRRK